MAMSGPQVESLLSDNLSTYLREYLDRSRGLVSAFQRLSPALQQLKSFLNLDGDVRIGRQYRTLCRSVRHGAEQTLVVTDLLDGVQSMKQNRQRWERIDRELGAAIEGTSTVGQQYTYLRDFESELSVRMEGLLRAQDKLRIACQQIKQENNALNGQSTVGSTTSFWHIRYTHFGVVALCILVLVSPFCSQFLYGRFGFPPYLTYSLIFLGGCCSMYLMWKYQKRKAKENEIFTEVNKLVLEIYDLGETSIRTAVRRSTFLPQVKSAVERFFNQPDHENIEKYKAELKFLFANL